MSRSNAKKRLPAPVAERLEWESYVEGLIRQLEATENLPEWRDPTWRNGMIAYYNRQLEHAFKHEPPDFRKGD